MKNLFWALCVVAGFAFHGIAIAEAKPEVKKVCMKQKDAKTGKEKEVCKNVKEHKKHEGTEVPTKK
jgi:hypothetical protein